MKEELINYFNEVNATGSEMDTFENLAERFELSVDEVREIFNHLLSSDEGLGVAEINEEEQFNDTDAREVETTEEVTEVDFEEVAEI